MYYYFLKDRFVYNQWKTKYTDIITNSPREIIGIFIAYTISKLSG
mgnify:CR=1